MKLLIADDNAQNRYLLEQLLTQTGHQVVSVTNGAEALLRLRAEMFDACISDVLMPTMDGFQFCREVKSTPDLARLPIIFYTATYTDPADAEFGRRLGASHYIVKPAEPEVILGALRDLGAAPPAPAFAPPAEDDYLVQYNARLVHKLEAKMQELERANANLLKTNLALGDEISRRRRAEKSARAAYELQRATLESTTDGILATDADGVIVAVNHSFGRLWQLPAETAVAGTFAELLARLHGGPQAEAARLWQRAADRSDLIGLETMHLPGGRILERQVRPLQTPDGRTGRVWTFRDVTDQRRAEEGRRALQGQLFELQKMEALGVLAGGIAHDFNNILTIILGQASLAEGQLPEGHAAREALANVTGAGARAADLVRQILAFSRNQKPERVPLRLEAVVADAVRLMQSTLPAAVRVVTDVAPDLPEVLADRTQLHQVLMNLASNAEQAMEGRGTLGFTLRVEEAGDQDPRDLRPGRYVFLGVRDSGPGIDEHVLQRIFEPFFTTKPAGRGTGLGLAVVHGIITGYGGHVRVESRPGEGAEFQVFLPVAADQAAAESTPRAAGLRRGNGERVLVAEDDEGVRGFVATLLERLNYRSVCCESGEEAFEKFRLEPDAFDLVLTDLSMAGMSGSQFAAQVRKVRPGLPVILMTGYFSAADLKPDSQAMQFELLLKPCSATNLSEAIYRVLNLHR